MLSDPASVEQAENDGIVEIDRDGKRLQARLAHPLYGEARRASIGTLRSRRLRGRIATAMAGTGARRVDDTLRCAVLVIDSDLDPDVRLLTEAAERAMQLIDFGLANRLGRAAVAAGGGFRAQRVIAFAATWAGSPADAEAELAALAESAGTDAERVTASLMHAVNLAWVRIRPTEAEAVLDSAASRVTSPDVRRPLMGLRAMLDTWLGRPLRAAATALEVLAAPDASDESVVAASCGLAGAWAMTGHAEDLRSVVARGETAIAASPQLANYRMPLTSQHVIGLILAGYLEEAAAAARVCREQLQDTVLGEQHSGLLTGWAELATGRLASAQRWLRQTRAGLEPFGDIGGWRFATLIGSSGRSRWLSRLDHLVGVGVE